MENRAWQALPHESPYREYASIPSEVFRFDLRGRKPIYQKERGKPGEVVRVLDATLTHLGETPLPPNVKVKDVFVSSPVIDADPERFEIADDFVERIEAHLMEIGINPAVQRQIEDPDEFRQKYHVRNHRETPYSVMWYGSPEMAALKLWRKRMVPRAYALSVLGDPRGGDLLVDPRTGITVQQSDESATILGMGRDAEGIRARPPVYERILLEHFSSRPQKGLPIEAVSLGSGTGGPTIAALKALGVAYGIRSLFTPVDRDPIALGMLQGVSEHYGYKGVRPPIQIDLRSRTEMQQVKFDPRGKPKRFKVIDGIGILEYVEDEDDLIHFQDVGNDPEQINTAAEFVQEYYDALDDDGIMVLGNMELERAHINYLLNVVVWPYIKPRPLEQLLSIMQKAGVVDHPQTDQITFWRVQYPGKKEIHLYNLASITKLPR